ncbi:MAG: polysaccharide biosynthesis/export family protein [Thermodesulfobacteriota bacterium]
MKGVTGLSRPLTLLCGLLAWIACCNVSPLWGQEGRGDEKDYLIGVGDVLEVQVWQEPDLSRTVKVRLDGRISLPLTGDIQAAGKSVEELDRLLEEKIAALVTEPAVSVILVENRSRRYYVVGQVGQPGEFPIEYPLTLLQAIARSGGFQEWAKRDQIRVVRRIGDKEDLLPFDYDAFVKGKDLGQNIFIAPGDTIIVP